MNHPRDGSTQRAGGARKGSRRFHPQRDAPVRSREEKKALLVAFKSCSSSEKQLEFLSEKNFSRSSIYRWQREFEKKIEDVALLQPTQPIDTAIATLSDLLTPSTWPLIEAIWRFCAWLRWPTEPRQQQTAVAVYAAAYLAARRGNVLLSKLFADEANVLLRHVSLNDIALSMASINYGYVDFTDFSNREKPYFDRNLLRDIVAYMVADQEEIGPAGVSLNKAFYLIEGGAIGHERLRSRRTFDVLWRRLGVSAPFHFVDQDDCSLNWHLDPFEPDYAVYVDEIASAHEERRTYFAKSAWVIRRMRDRLDPRAIRATPFPTFPIKLEPLPTTCPALSHDVRDQLAVFGKK